MNSNIKIVLPTFEKVPPEKAIWPENGYEILQQVARKTVKHREDLVEQGIADTSGTANTYIFQAGDWCLKTSQRRHFQTLDQGREELERLASKKLQLATLLPPSTVLYLQENDDGSCWLWTITPWLTTIRTALSKAAENQDQNSLGKLLQAFAWVAIKSIELVIEKEITLDVHPSNFAIINMRVSITEMADNDVVYLDDDIPKGSRMPTIGYAILRPFDEYERWSNALDLYELSIRELLFTRIDREAAVKLELSSAFSNLPLRTLRARNFSQELSNLIERRRR